MQRFYVGTYSQGDGDIFTLTLDGEHAKLELASVYGGCENASFLALKGDRLYAVSELPDGGAIHTLAIMPDGSLAPFARLIAPYPALCHISVWPGGKALSAASYLGGGVCTCPLDPGGAPQGPLQWLPNSGCGSDPARQEGPHAHSITPDVAGRFFVQADLGTDELLLYRPLGAQLQLHDRVQVSAGEGPRHFAFHPSGRYAYLITELQNHIIAYGYDAQTGWLWQRQTCPLLLDGAPQGCLGADIHLSREGSYVYASVRGVDYLVRYHVRPDGLLEHRASLLSGAAAVRNFCLDKSGRYMLVADQQANEVLLFELGKAGAEGIACLGAVRVPSPVCIVEA